ncbi:helix-turn-helix domain-containing protein [Rhodococcus hoagii]|nr:helix-turn-helix domain-containing protein [Prescottella equi]NKW34878.1 helix-turn-helix domain-containing protein [Prescottella equi]NKW34895.1 helix-turn-helix domain-containing protein [Prescottella equi]NKZ71100.1 helix-turn-helix domain-containing protein [Prescottella equi]
MDDDRLLRIRDVAEILATSTRTVGRLYRTGELPCVRVGPNGKQVRFLRSDVEDYIRRRRVHGPM